MKKWNLKKVRSKSKIILCFIASLWYISNLLPCTTFQFSSWSSTMHTPSNWLGTYPWRKWSLKTSLPWTSKSRGDKVKPLNNSYRLQRKGEIYHILYTTRLQNSKTYQHCIAYIHPNSRTGNSLPTCIFGIDPNKHWGRYYFHTAGTKLDSHRKHNQVWNIPHTSHPSGMCYSYT